MYVQVYSISKRGSFLINCYDILFKNKILILIAEYIHEQTLSKQHTYKMDIKLCIEIVLNNFRNK